MPQRTVSTSDPGASEPGPRERLLEALATSIREKGLRATQIADIVRLARTSRRTFYECFPDKESCFVELIRDATTLLLSEIEAAIEPAAPWERQVEQAVDAYISALTEDPAVTAIISRELPALGLRGAEVQREGIERYASMIVGTWRSAAADRAGLRDLPYETAVMLVGGINELVIHAVERGTPLTTVATVAKDVIKAVLRPVPGERGPA